MKKFILIVLLSILFISTPASTKNYVINFKIDFKRLNTLQKKFNNTNNPVEKYLYSQTMLEYIKDMECKIQTVHKVYYKSALLFLTDEIRRKEKK